MLHAIAKNVWGNNVIKMSSTQQQGTHTYQMGGTCTMAHGKISGYTQNTYIDKYGRWTEVHMLMKNNKKLCIMTGYLPCTNETPGPLTFHMQLVTSSHPVINHP